MTKSVFKQSVSKLFLVVLVIFSLMIGLIALPFARDMLLHNQALGNLEIALHQIDHPVDTTFVRDFKSMGVLSGNSNHCDYIAGELRRYSGDKQEIQNFYTNEEIYVIFLENGRIPENAEFLLSPSALEKLLYGENPAPDAQSKMYLVILTDMFNDPGYDFRCS